MTKPQTRDVLNRLLAIHCHSLPMYVAHASPWIHRGDEKALQVLSHIVADQQTLAARLADYIIEHYGRVETGEYPMEFTDIHDLALDYLIGRLVQAQERDVAQIERCVAELQSEPAVRPVAEEALGAARGHLELLQELVKERAARNGGQPLKVVGGHDAAVG